MQKTCGLILAAGKGTRMNSATPKALFEILEKPMIYWVLNSFKKANIDKICTVLGYGYEEVKKHLESNIYIAIQKNQQGTADAVKSARNFLEKNKESDIFIACADSPLIDENTIKNSYILHKKTNACATIITAKLKNPHGFGRIIRNVENNNVENNVVEIVEQKDLTKEQTNIEEVNSGAYWFCCKDLLLVIDKIFKNNAQKEYYLTDTIKLLVKKNKIVNSFLSDNSNLIVGVNTKKDLLKVSEIAINTIIEKFVEKGIEFIKRDGIIIYPDVKIGKNTKILPGSIIKNGSIIGKNCVIGPNSFIEESIIGDFCNINASQIYKSEIQNHTTIGPYCHIRPNSKISYKVKIGDFVEIKNSNIGAGTSISHLTYIGDSDVGKNVNFGCGVVTINYDGVKKYRCTIEDGAFIGCNTNLVAPVCLGKNSYTAAGSTITKNVPEEALGIERTKQKNIENFSKRKLLGRKLKVED